MLRKKENESTPVTHRAQRHFAKPIIPDIAKLLRDPTEWIQVEHLGEIAIVQREAGAVLSGVQSALPKAKLISTAGEMKGSDFIPHHFLTMAPGIRSQELPFITVDVEGALDYLERKIPVIPGEYSNGWDVVTFDGDNLGWLKKTGQGWKNYYPMNWRLRKRT